MQTWREITFPDSTLAPQSTSVRDVELEPVGVDQLPRFGQLRVGRQIDPAHRISIARNRPGDVHTHWLGARDWDGVGAADLRPDAGRAYCVLHLPDGALADLRAGDQLHLICRAGGWHGRVTWVPEAAPLPGQRRVPAEIVRPLLPAAETAPPRARSAAVRQSGRALSQFVTSRAKISRPALPKFHLPEASFGKDGMLRPGLAWAAVLVAGLVLAVGGRGGPESAPDTVIAEVETSPIPETVSVAVPAPRPVSTVASRSMPVPELPAAIPVTPDDVQPASSVVAKFADLPPGRLPVPRLRPGRADGEAFSLVASAPVVEPPVLEAAVLEASVLEDVIIPPTLTPLAETGEAVFVPVAEIVPATVGDTSPVEPEWQIAAVSESVPERVLGAVSLAPEFEVEFDVLPDVGVGSEPVTIQAELSGPVRLGYPASAQWDARVPDEVVVVVAFTVEATGRVSGARVTETSLSNDEERATETLSAEVMRDFEVEALRAVQGQIYSPKTVDGVAVADDNFIQRFAFTRPQ